MTSGPSAGSTYVQWSAHFSSDADAGRLLVSPYLFLWCFSHWLQKKEKKNIFLLIMRQTGVIEDARYKRKEALADLANAVTKGPR